MKIHVLPGDSLTESFRQTNIDGEIIVCRECLVDGDVRSENLKDFWQVRAQFIKETYGESTEKYFQDVTGEFEKLIEFSSDGAEMNLWFEYELFCQVNLWFTLYLLRESAAKIFRVAPSVRNQEEIWKGFGGLRAADLKKCFAERIEFSEKDIQLGADLWKAYQNKDYESLERFSETDSKCLPYLKEVCRAEIEKSARPVKVLVEIIAEGKTDFAEIFPEFSKKAGVYGFGDAQVKRILAQI
jgi:hypothetical protein